MSLPIKEREMLMAVMAELGALRHVLVHAMALRLIEEPSPLVALQIVERQLTAQPSVPPQGAGLDPAISDMLSALTDERTGGIMADLRARLQALGA